MEDPKRLWLPCPHYDAACGFISDRWSSFVVGANLRRTIRGIGLFAYDNGGMILRPEFNDILCGYGGDGGSRGRVCRPPGVRDDCVPGCTTFHTLDRWCEPSDGDAGDGWCSGRAWRPEHLAVLGERHNNRGGYIEVILNAKYLNEHLPLSIEAIFYPLAPECGPKCQTKARQTHRDLLKYHGLTAEDVPLL